MSRSWGLPVFVLVSFLAAMAPMLALRFWKDLPFNPVGEFVWSAAPYMPVLWIPLTGLAILWHGKRAA